MRLVYWYRYLSAAEFFLRTGGGAVTGGRSVSRLLSEADYNQRISYLENALVETWRTVNETARVVQTTSKSVSELCGYNRTIDRNLENKWKVTPFLPGEYAGCA